MTTDAQVPQAAAPDDATRVDGRRMRSARSRDAVVDALLALYDEGVLKPGAAQIAERAGVSERSVFRHFDDIDALVAATATRQLERIGHLFLPPAVGGSRRRRVQALVEQRLAIHDAAGAVIRAAELLEPDSPRLSGMFEMRRRALGAQVADLFAAELDRRDGDDRAEVLDALVAVFGIEHVEHLRVDLGCTREHTARVIERTALALLSSRPLAPEGGS